MSGHWPLFLAGAAAGIILVWAGIIAAVAVYGRDHIRERLRHGYDENSGDQGGMPAPPTL